MSTADHPPKRHYRAMLNLMNAVLPRQPWADRLWLWLRFWVEHGRRPTRERRYNDMLYYHSVSGALQADRVKATTCKHNAKLVLGSVFGPDHLVPTLAVLATPHEIDAYDFPRPCVIKGTAASGQYLLHRGPGDPDRRLLKRWLGKTHYDHAREANYKGLSNRIIVEPTVYGETLCDDLKFICWKGKVRWLYFASHQSGEKRSRLLTPDWQVLPVGSYFPYSDAPVARPDCYEAMYEAATQVAADFEFVRIDFFFSGAAWMFGEITHLDGGASCSFIPLAGEALLNALTFGKDAYTGPLERHGALGAAGPIATHPRLKAEV